MKKLPISKLNDFFSAVSKAGNKVYLPVDIGEGKGADYKLWEEGVELSKALNTNRSAKDFFFPQTENLFELKMDGKNIDVIDTRTEAEDFVVFGVRACDVRSFDILDRVFLANPVDTYYKNRREHGVIISLACTKPAETCFCTAFGIDPTNPGADASAWISGDYLYIECNTEKAAELQASVDAVCEDADASELDETKENTKKILDKLPLANIPLDKISDKELKELFYSDKWQSMSEACLGCGTCTYVCPTCQCYDIREFDTGHGIKRFRCWDSCMYSDFTKMAHGNPRLTQTERFRQRFMHKLVYYPNNNEGIFGCVGCGRCVASCPISRNIAGVVRELAKGGKAE